MEDNLFSYLKLYYCRLDGAKPLAMIIIILWLMLLFTTLGIVAGDFFSVNLSSLAQSLNFSDALAGVTFLAFGNGAPDIFSTFAAMKSNSHSLALGELLGAAAFITSVVAGSMALIKPFAVVKASLIRDGLVLIVAMAFLIYVMADGYLRLPHCICMLAIYAVYVVIVAGWHWWISRRKRGPENTGEGEAPHNEESAPTASSESTPLLPESHNVHLTSSQIDRMLRADQSAAAEWEGEGQRVMDFRRINPSLTTTLHYRHHKRSNMEYPAPFPCHNTSSSCHECSTAVTSLGTVALEQQQQHVSRYEVHSTGKTRGSFQHVISVLFPTLQHLKTDNALHIALNLATALSTLVLMLTLPVVSPNSEADDQRCKDRGDHGDWNRWLLVVQAFFAPQFILALIAHQLAAGYSNLLKVSVICLGGSVLFAALILVTTTTNTRPRWYKFLSVPGFIISIAWISLVADEMVAILNALGVICNIPDALLGITIFAIGNSLDDLAANISVAQHDHPVMALSACFGGPLLSVLLGISVSGIFVLAKGLKNEHHITAINLRPNQTLFITAGMIIAIVMTMLVMMVWTRWRMTKPVGYTLIAIWLIGTTANLTLVIKN